MRKTFIFPFLVSLGGILGVSTRLPAQDFTEKITNPGFETGNYNGWTLSGSGGLSWCGVNSDADAGTKTGTYIFGIWNPDIPEFEIAQTVSGLSNGVYRLTVDMQMSATSAGFSRLGGQRIFAGNYETYYRDVAYEDFLGYDNTPLHPISVLGEVTNGSLKIGVRTNGKDANGTAGGNGMGWFKIDNFRLELVSQGISYVQTTINEVNTLLERCKALGVHIEKETLEEMTARIEAAEEALKTPDKITALQQAFDRLTQIYQKAEKSAKAYEKLHRTLSEAKKKLTGFEGYLYAPALEKLVAECETRYEEALIPHTEIDELRKALEATIRTCEFVGVAQANCTGDLVNPSFETGNYDGWMLSYPASTSFTWCAAESSGDINTRTGAYIFGIWNSSIPEFEIAQTIAGLAPGEYKVTVDMMVSAGTSGESRLAGQRLFAGTEEIYFREVYEEDNLGYDDTPLHTLSLNTTVGNDGVLKLGVRTDRETAQGTNGNSGAGWFKIDNFQLFCVEKSAQLPERPAATYELLPDGLVVHQDTLDLKVQFYSPSIARVLKYPRRLGVVRNDISVTKQPEGLSLSAEVKGDSLIVRSPEMSAVYSLSSGQFSFTDASGETFLKEKPWTYWLIPCKDGDDDSYAIKQTFLPDDDEVIYGLGQIQDGDLSRRGKEILLRQDNMKVCIPYIHSSKNYACFWDNYSPTTFSDNESGMSFSSTGKVIDYYVLKAENGDGVIARMRKLTGEAPMMPLWTFGYYQSKERYASQSELVNVVKQYRNLGVPLDCIIQDWQYWGSDGNWNAMNFVSSSYPNPKGMVDEVHALNAKIKIVAWPGFGPQTAQAKELKAKGMMIDFETWPPGSGTIPYDVYNPEARDIYWNSMKSGLYDLGFDGWWLDSTEPDHVNLKESDFDLPTHLGTFRSVRNAFPISHVGGIYDHQRAVSSGQRVNILTRSAFAGQQRYAANTWSGDVTASFATLRKQIPAALNFTMCGIPYWNSDIGGFFVNYSGGCTNPAYRELYVRWAQFGAFCPMMRSHGTSTPREIYQFGSRGTAYFDAIEKYINLRYRLLPYSYSTAWQVTNRAGSFMRALNLEFGNDANCSNVSDEYLYGRSFLVAPKLEELSVSDNRTVYLPAGTNWIDFWTGEHLQGGTSVQKATPLDILPLYVKAGSIVPWGPQVEYSGEKNWDNLEIRIYPGANGSFVLYEDETDTYNYEKGLYSEIPFTWDDTTNELVIGKRNGRFDGMLEKRTFHIVYVTPKNGAGDAASSYIDKMASYSGEEIRINLQPVSLSKIEESFPDVYCKNGTLFVKSQENTFFSLSGLNGKLWEQARIYKDQLYTFPVKAEKHNLLLVQVGRHCFKVFP